MQYHVNPEQRLMAVSVGMIGRTNTKIIFVVGLLCRLPQSPTISQRAETCTLRCGKAICRA